jgi:hypothetical protein
MIRTEEDDEFARIEHENEMKKGQPYYFKKRTDDDDIQDYVRPWVGLTVEEIEEIGKPAAEKDGSIQAWGLFALAIEAKLKERNS